ncbi:nucleoporin Nup120/160-domain-containing protein [Lipomyces japonicus]|uniref:nucleoporin Nup120/160-domain-containing protein n=1 Tax=Lipomyces japonicus TaxID=56871 RepID=UPI0034CD082B
MPRDPSKYLKEASIRVDSSSLEYPVIELVAPEIENEYPPVPSSRYQRPQINDDVEEIYSRRFVASQSSIFYCNSKSVFPRSILWRVLENNTVLDLLPVDSTILDEHLQSSPIKLQRVRISFSTPIKHAGVVISEHDDLLTIDVLTESLALYTFALNNKTFTGEWIRRPTTEWCHVHEPAHFNLRPPHFMTALTGGSLVFALLDGGLIRLDRSHPLSNDYTERIFSDGSYLASLRGMFLWGSSDKVKGHPSVSTNLVVSMAAIPNLPLLITASISSCLKLWSLDSLTSINAYDISSDQERALLPNNKKVLLELEPSTLISTAQVDDLVYIATYCPLGDGQFRIWKLAIDRSDGFAAELVDLLQTSIRPVAPDDNAIWMITDFELVQARNGLDLFVLWKSNKSSRVHALFDILTVSGNNSAQHWRSVGLNSMDRLDSTGYFNTLSEDITERYLQSIFQPGVFSPAIIESVLPVYEQHYSASDAAKQISKTTNINLSLVNRVANAVSASVSLSASLYGNLDSLDYESYNRDLQQQWTRFERLCLELSKHGEEALSLARDPINNIVWVVRGSTVSALRSCVGLEYAQLSADRGSNRSLDVESKSQPDIALLNALRSFRQQISQPVVADFISALVDDALKSPNFSVGDRMSTIYDNILNDQISDSAIDHLHRRLYHISDLENVLQLCYLEFNHVISQTFGRPSLNTRRHLTTIGATFLSTSVHDSVVTTYGFLVDILLFLVVFAVDISEEFSADHIFLYDRFLQIFKTYSFLKILTETVLASNLNLLTEDEALAQTVDQLDVSRTVVAAGKKFRPGDSILQFLLSKFELGLACTVANDLVSGIVGVGDAVEYVISYWSIHSSPSAAIGGIGALLSGSYVYESERVTPYLSVDGVSTYVKGRVYLALGDAEQASLYFSRASANIAGAQLSDVNRLALSFFSKKHIAGLGVSAYAIHVSDLLFKNGAFVQSSEFARLAVDINDGGDIDRLRAKAYRAAQGGALYDAAYQSLVEIQNSDIRISLLEGFVIKLCENDQSFRLAQYPFLELHGLVESILEQKARSSVDVRSSPNYYKILYGWRVEHGNLRDASSALYEYIQRLRSGLTSQVDNFNEFDIDVSNSYVVLMSTLSCIDEKPEPWFLARKTIEAGVSSPSKKPKTSYHKDRSQRTLVRLSDVRREYGEEVLRMESILQKQLVGIA